MKLDYYTSDGLLNANKEFDKILYQLKLDKNKGNQALKDVIIAQQSNKRQGNASTKTRAEVSGSGKKPWKQKGTGMARHGSKRSPIWRGGGVAHGPRPSKIYTKKINKKVKLLALKRIFLNRINENCIKIISNFDINNYKSKNLYSIILKIFPNISKNILLIDHIINSQMILSSKNLKNINYKKYSFVNVLDFLKYKNILMTEDSLLKFINERIKININN